MKRNLKQRAVVSPTPTILAAAYDFARLKPIIYDEERFAYRPVGEVAAKAFNTGLTFKKEKP